MNKNQKLAICISILALSINCSIITHQKLPKWNDSMSNGCSYPGGEAEAPIPFTLAQHQCCVVHDSKYYVGGSPLDKLHADDDLYTCLLKANMNPLVVDSVYFGVSAFGGPEFRVPNVSWAFGGSRFKFTNKPAEMR